MARLKKALLVYPDFPKSTYWSYTYALKFINKQSAFPPLGLITVASLFPEGTEFRLVDMNLRPLTDDDVQWADAVFASAMIVQKESLSKVVEQCNRLDKPIVVGGPYATTCTEQITGADHLLLGEVEDIFQGFLEDFRQDRAKPRYSAEKRPCITQTRIPRFDLLDMDSYVSMSVQYSRGCPFACEFCDIWKIYGNRPRVKSKEDMLAEVDKLYGLGWRGPVFFVDDNFIGNKRSIKHEVLPALYEWQKSHGFVYRFFTEASINIAEDEELLTIMRDVGFNEVFLGIETPSLESLQSANKKHNLKSDMGEAIRKIQEFGMAVMAGFIVGFDNETDDIFERQIRFIQDNGIPQAMVGMLTALPGTELHNRLEKEGRMLEESTGNNTHCMATNFKTTMDSEKLKEGYKQILAHIYDSNLKNYFGRCNVLLDRLGENPLFNREVQFDEIKTFAKSLILQAFSRYGFQYLRFVASNLIYRRKSFPEAIRLAVVGHHFHTITQETLKAESVSENLESIYENLRKQLEQYSLILSKNSKEATEYVVTLWKQSKNALQEAQQSINRIHVDFQTDLARKYADISAKIGEMFLIFEHEIRTEAGDAVLA